MKMKKQRGLRRYYKNLAIQNDFERMFFLGFQSEPNAWFDKWHWHFDWRGIGNNSFRRRKPHLDKLFRHFEILVEKSKHLKIEFQLFVLILDNDSSSDAVYLHTPNPNAGDFLLTWENISEKCTLKNKDLIEYVNQLSKYEKLYGVADEPFCILLGKNIGVSKTLYQAGLNNICIVQNECENITNA
jgi:hypothetical protein